ncbi:diguanylate cyclase (GGDEF) domain-containing protein [Quadrisphaera granulorum]|uniref:Diguanylate cyclase (GGDEF)-like protein n=1 Tax=Quadrisphaera granulorum TaxID=317664 RepID=A0A316A1K6_9ACTN|nr:diguanylate cyclase (GGDEF)-like protein [Quadrisphaera granulorum]SZE97678.1 diguanylate cyclase (GGDEF) domain-containing protein [Quadrisphaera granulorum]
MSAPTSGHRLRRTRWHTLILELSRAQPVASLTAMVWTTSLVMLACGAYIAVASLLRTGFTAPGPPFWVGVAACLGGAVIFLGRRYYRKWYYHFLQPATGLAAALGIHLDGGGTASVADASLYLVLAALAFFFFPWTTAGIHVVVNTALLVLALGSVPGVATGDILIMVCGNLVVGGIVGALSRLTASAVLAAEVDVLTALPNRRGTQSRLLTALAGHRAGAPLSLAIIDLDHFKQVNDSLGHAAGDELLRAAATAWWAILPPSAVLGRWGGDEFVMLARLEPVAAGQLVDALREALPAGRSCTAGVTGLGTADDVDSAMRRADQALYVAKRAGRGRTRVWTPEDVVDQREGERRSPQMNGPEQSSPEQSSPEQSSPEQSGPDQPWLESQPSMRSDSGSSASSEPSGPVDPSSGASSRSMPTAFI